MVLQKSEAIVFDGRAARPIRVAARVMQFISFFVTLF